MCYVCIRELTLMNRLFWLQFSELISESQVFVSGICCVDSMIVENPCDPLSPNSEFALDNMIT